MWKMDPQYGANNIDNMSSLIFNFDMSWSKSHDQSKICHINSIMSSGGHVVVKQTLYVESYGKRQREQHINIMSSLLFYFDMSR